MPERTTLPGGQQARPWLGPADLLTVARLPLAAAFVLTPDPERRLLLLALAAASDLLDGGLARAVGGSRLGPLLDPVADRLFMAATFLVLAVDGALTFPEVLLVLARDIFTSASFFATALHRRPRHVPARVSGKAVTLAQMLTLVAFLTGSALLRPVAWLAIVLGVAALVDYERRLPREAKGVGE